MSPTIGITVLGSGSRGNSTLVHCGEEAVLIDAGFSLSELKKRLTAANKMQMKVRAVLVTHEHEDHIRGLRVCANYFDAPIYATRKCAEAIRCHDEKIRQFALFAPGSTLEIGCFSVCPFSISHDASDPVAYVIYCNQLKIGVATDVGYVSSGVEYELKSCDGLVVESNHDLNLLAASNRPWSLKQRIMGRMGHLSNDAVQQLLEKVIDEHTKHIILGHLSQECNRPAIAQKCAMETLVRLGRQDISLDVASQENPLPTVWIG